MQGKLKVQDKTQMVADPEGDRGLCEKPSHKVRQKWGLLTRSVWIMEVFCGSYCITLPGLQGKRHPRGKRREQNGSSQTLYPLCLQNSLFITREGTMACFYFMFYRGTIECSMWKSCILVLRMSGKIQCIAQKTAIGNPCQVSALWQSLSIRVKDSKRSRESRDYGES